MFKFTCRHHSESKRFFIIFPQVIGDKEIAVKFWLHTNFQAPTQFVNNTQNNNYLIFMITNIPVRLWHLVQWRVQKSNWQQTLGEQKVYLFYSQPQQLNDQTLKPFSRQILSVALVLQPNLPTNTKSSMINHINYEKPHSRKENEVFIIWENM